MSFKDKARAILEQHDEKYWQRDLALLPPKERLKILLELAEFVEPKGSKTDVGDVVIKVIRE
jgi:hypothetical protein